jgi:polyisoprenyl-teichoic acid--peptidoglycan teichoic acid transferase
VGAAVFTGLVVVFALVAWRAADFLHGTLNVGNPVEQLNPPAGSVAWKMQHGQQVNLLLLGYGGAENDAPYLTDTLMTLRLDPNTRQALEISVPRDLKAQYKNIDGQPVDDKINTVYSNAMNVKSGDKDRGGKAAIQVMSQVTGLQYDGYVAVDFKAFRDVVDALGGVDVCLDSPLDDNQYPNYSNGYVKGGVHFKAGCQHVNGEQALEIARSRHAEQPEQASDFARAKRQQLIISAIKKKATSVDAITKAPQLMGALQQDMSTNLTLTDLKAMYNWSKQVNDNSIKRVSIDNTNFVTECTSGGYALCPIDSDYNVLHSYLANAFVDPNVLKEGAAVQVANGSASLPEMGNQVSATLQPLGFKMASPVRTTTRQQSVVYDYSNGKYPQTVRWLSSYFHANVVTPPAGAAPTPSPPQGGVVVQLGRDFSVRWVGESS